MSEHGPDHALIVYLRGCYQPAQEGRQAKQTPQVAEKGRKNLHLIFVLNSFFFFFYFQFLRAFTIA